MEIPITGFVVDNGDDHILSIPTNCLSPLGMEGPSMYMNLAVSPHSTSATATNMLERPNRLPAECSMFIVMQQSLRLTLSTVTSFEE